MDFESAFAWVTKGGIAAVLAGILYSLHRGWLVLGREYQTEKKRADAYQALLERLANVAGKAIASEHD